MTPSDTDPPAAVPEEIVAELETSDERQLRETIHYAQRLLRDRSSDGATEQSALVDAVDAREGEELVRMEDHGGYTTVVVERPDESGEARGPFAYMVRREPHVDGGGGYKWHYLGRVFDEGGL